VTPVNVDAKEWGKASPATFFGACIKAFGASRIAWGSNFPATAGPLADILARAQTAFAFASPSEREWIFGKTAQALYPRLAD
jgi:predicted TIM-barrel fold metal-dependent hydrolase